MFQTPGIMNIAALTPVGVVVLPLRWHQQLERYQP